MAVGVICVAGYYGYYTGQLMARREVRLLNDQIDDLGRTIADLERYNLVLADSADQAKVNESQWRQRYVAAVTNLEFRRVFANAAADGGQGIDAARLAFNLGAARREGQCDETPAIKRFRVHTPANDGGRDFAGFGNNAIVVSAAGLSAMNRTGQPLAWFDPTQPISVTFKTREGASSVAGGILPLNHSFVFDEAEYRFSVERSGRGFVAVTANRCEFGG